MGGCGLEERGPELHGVLGGVEEEFVCGEVGEVLPIDEAFDAGERGARGAVVFEVRGVWAEDGRGERAEEVGRGWAEEEESVALVGEVGDGDVFGDNVGREGFVGALRGVRVEREEDSVLKVDDAEIGVDASLAVEPEGAGAGEGSEGAEVLRDHALEEVESLGARDLEHGAMGGIEEDAGLAYGGVLELDVGEGFGELDVLAGAGLGGVARCIGIAWRGVVDCGAVGGEGGAGLFEQLAEGCASGHDSRLVWWGFECRGGDDTRARRAFTQKRSEAWRAD